MLRADAYAQFLPVFVDDRHVSTMAQSASCVGSQTRAEPSAHFVEPLRESAPVQDSASVAIECALMTTVINRTSNNVFASHASHKCT